jgi:hypothetical protein
MKFFSHREDGAGVFLPFLLGTTQNPWHFIQNEHWMIVKVERRKLS